MSFPVVLQQILDELACVNPIGPVLEHDCKRDKVSAVFIEPLEVHDSVVNGAIDEVVLVFVLCLNLLQLLDKIRKVARALSRSV